MFTHVDVKLVENYMDDSFTAVLNAHILSRTNRIQEVTYYPPRQGFWGWISGRKPKPFTVTIKANEVLKAPPKVSGHTIMMFETEIL